ncbi:hypothetical protein B0H67DRAFT_559276 [Lasiosphaeris hirsuta]|uniref:Uncharacterized protein n=1 Tax=Lasiosphaeris hirsuta TaxID=260670 RepID=A0AA40B8J7_9PEZI|nr:hypothetical protein B0H67DRAFT_559276 [Lasiosphaeris hirsuta]
MSHFTSTNATDHAVRQGDMLRGTGRTIGESSASGPAPTTSGHHKHDVLNKIDPRVDSSHDKQPMPQHNPPAGTHGPHSSRLANILDPRVHSDNSNHNRQQGVAGSGAAMHGGLGQNNTASGGQHNSRIANQLDPSVDSMSNRGAATVGYPGHNAGFNQNTDAGYAAGTGLHQTNHHHIGHHQQAAYPSGHMGGSHPVNDSSLPGPAPHTAGPHHSDLLNKLDPSVDSKAGYNGRTGI